MWEGWATGGPQAPAPVLRGLELQVAVLTWVPTPSHPRRWCLLLTPPAPVVLGGGL